MLSFSSTHQSSEIFFLFSFECMQTPIACIDWKCMKHDSYNSSTSTEAAHFVVSFRSVSVMQEAWLMMRTEISLRFSFRCHFTVIHVLQGREKNYCAWDTVEMLKFQTTLYKLFSKLCALAASLSKKKTKNNRFLFCGCSSYPHLCESYCRVPLCPSFSLSGGMDRCDSIVCRRGNIYLQCYL